MSIFKIDKTPIEPICDNCVHKLPVKDGDICINSRSRNYKQYIKPDDNCNKFNKKIKLDLR